MTWLDVITSALQEIGYVGANETPSADDGAKALEIANRILDTWNLERHAVYADVFTTFALTPALQPHTIGPTGATWTMAVRPVEILSAVLITAGTRMAPMLTVTAQEWARYAAALSGTPSLLYYAPTWPNGSLYFRGIPSVADSVELLTRVLLSSVATTTTFTLPPGYQEALTLTLAEQCCRPFARQKSADLADDARQARARIWTHNAGGAPRLITHDAGMPGGRGTFDFETLSWH